MNIGIKVGDIMTRNYISISPDTNLLECAKIMIKKRVGSLIIKENGALKGLITERDIIWCISKKSKQNLEDIKAIDFSPKKLISISPSSDLYTALIKMKRSKYRWLPVVVKKNVVGFLTIKDILKIEPTLFDIARQSYLIKEESEKIKRIKDSENKNLQIGICEECGNQGILEKVDGIYICESCKDSM